MGRSVVDIQSEGVMPLSSIPDVIGLAGRRSDAAECCILQGRDVRSVCVLVPDLWGLDQNFHDVTNVDMGDVPESSVAIPELLPYRNYRCFVSSGHLRFSVTWCGSSRN